MGRRSLGISSIRAAAHQSGWTGWWRPEFVPKLFRNFSSVRAGGSNKDLQLGRFRVDLRTGEVSGPHGGTTVLRPKTTALLQLLSTRPGELFSKDELLETVWPDSVVDEDGLVQCIGEIRRALEDDGRTALRTHAKRGYSLHPSALPERSKSVRGWNWVAAILLVLALAGAFAVFFDRTQADTRAAVRSAMPIVAVFPFAASVESPRWNRLARAMTEDIIGDLAQSSWLGVLADTTTRNAGAPGPATAASLGARYFVSGSIGIEDKTARINAVLTETSSGRQLWSKRAQGPIGDVLAMQQATSEALVSELSSHADGPIARADRAMARGRGTDNLGAYELFLLASEKIETYRQEDLEEAVTMLRRVVQLAPEFGEAWAKLSLTIYITVSPDMSEAEIERRWKEGDAAALQGYRVSPDNPRALAQGANAIRWDNPAEAERMVRRAAELAPNNADVLAYLAFRTAHYPALAADAERWMARAMELNPSRPAWYDWNRGTVMMVLGRYQEAAQAYALAPDHIEAKGSRIAALALAGDIPAARRLLTEVLAVQPDFTISFHRNAAGLDDQVAAIFARGLKAAGAVE
jgi:TolB-like protein/DNA-binding winged helix-turn-helix (wHTH) protein/cytochrome c-type biogenesis protein CcmH/NrfG